MGTPAMNTKLSSGRVFLIGAIVMTIVLAWAAVHSQSGHIFANRLHAPAHFAAFAIVAFAWARGLPKVPAWAMMLAIVAIGFGHEAVEILGHGHAFEIADVCYDAAGAIAGVLLARARLPGAKVAAKPGL